jgi:leucyl-tRNA synthetase
MELVNLLYQAEDFNASPYGKNVLRKAVETVITLLSPMVPHFADELWECIGKTGNVLREPWPVWKQEALVTENMLIVVQVNGKLRSRFTVSADAGEEEIKERALGDERVQQYISGKALKKVIYVKNKLVNIVI